MVSRINKVKKSRGILVPPSLETKKIISEEDIRKRAFEVFQENECPSCNELDNWYYAERELTGYYN